MPDTGCWCNEWYLLRRGMPRLYLIDVQIFDVETWRRIQIMVFVETWHAASLQGEKNDNGMKTEKFQNKYRIPSARAVWHDYNGGDYFITICTADRLHYFGEIHNGEMQKNALGIKLDELIKDIENHHPYAEIPVYQIMPNHVHLIVCIDVCRNTAHRKSMDDNTINGDSGCRDVARHKINDDCNNNRDGCCRDVACRVSTGKSDENAINEGIYKNVAYHQSMDDNMINAVVCRDAACHKINDDCTVGRRDAACHVSTGDMGIRIKMKQCRQLTTNADYCRRQWVV